MDFIDGEKSKLLVVYEEINNCLFQKTSKDDVQRWLCISDNNFKLFLKLSINN